MSKDTHGALTHRGQPLGAQLRGVVGEVLREVCGGRPVTFTHVVVIVVIWQTNTHMTLSPRWARNPLHNCIILVSAWLFFPLACSYFVMSSNACKILLQSCFYFSTHLCRSCCRPLGTRALWPELSLWSGVLWPGPWTHTRSLRTEEDGEKDAARQELCATGICCMITSVTLIQWLCRWVDKTVCRTFGWDAEGTVICAAWCR